MSYQRERFERHMINEKGFPDFMLEQGEDGRYLDMAIQNDWEMWQSATESDPGELIHTGPVDQS